MRLDSRHAISIASALAAALLLVPAAVGAESHRESGAKSAGHSIKGDADKAAKNVDKGAKDAVKATEKDTESMFTEDGQPRSDDPFALKPEGEADPSGK